MLEYYYAAANKFFEILFCNPFRNKWVPIVKVVLRKSINQPPHCELSLSLDETHTTPKATTYAKLEDQRKLACRSKARAPPDVSDGSAPDREIPKFP